MSSPSPSQNLEALDGLTGGVFSASTSGERAARLRQWIATDPAPADMQEVFKELSARDKGAARLLRERLDELRRARGQEALAAEWAAKAEALLALPRLNMADALAWQRDAAKAGAPLSKEPLAALKARLADGVRAIEDLQHRVQVQREAAVLLAQRIEVLSTKSWKDAQAAAAALSNDVPQWQAQADALVQEPGWPSVEARFPPLLEASRTQLQVVWDAFRTALGQAAAADLGGWDTHDSMGSPNPLRGAHHRCRLFRRYLKQVRCMALHRHQHVAGIDLAEVHEGQGQVVLENPRRRDLAADQPAEDAAVGRRRSRDACHGGQIEKIFPGFMIPSGSNSRLTRFNP